MIVKLFARLHIFLFPLLSAGCVRTCLYSIQVFSCRSGKRRTSTESSKEGYCASMVRVLPRSNLTNRVLSSTMYRVPRQRMVLACFPLSRPISKNVLFPQHHRLASSVGVPSLPGQVAPQADDGEEPSNPKAQESGIRSTLYKMFESSATTLASLLVLG